MLAKTLQGLLAGRAQHLLCCLWLIKHTNGLGACSIQVHGWDVSGRTLRIADTDVYGTTAAYRDKACAGITVGALAVLCAIWGKTALLSFMFFTVMMCTNSTVPAQSTMPGNTERYLQRLLCSAAVASSHLCGTVNSHVK
jgi:hypothetical protein